MIWSNMPSLGFGSGVIGVLDSPVVPSPLVLVLGPWYGFWVH